LTRWDVVVVGGGVAGLAAAGRLLQAGRRVILLEARPRLGGRIHTVLDPTTGHPVELGAEFIQGNPPDLLQILQRAGVRLQEVFEQHERARAGSRFQFPDVEELVSKLLDGAGPKMPDLPVSLLLRRHASRFSPRELEAITAYLEGFHGAALDRFGTAALAENQAAEQADQGSLLRPVGGYGRLVSALVSALESELAEIRTGAVVTKLRWSRGAVEVSLRTAGGNTAQVAGSQAIVAVPLSSLKGNPEAEGALQLDPMPPALERALDCLEMGTAHRIVLRFESAWWIEPDRPTPVFLHGRDEPFPVWWTSSPPESPFLTGWIGGPRALSLSGKSIEQLIPLALDSTSSIFSRPRNVLAGQLRAAYCHDWTADPYARGAYSYGGVRAAEAREVLRRPLSDTVFLAGEALVDEGRNATVPGALSSGLRSATALLQEASRLSP
jgi:monoamine oxidase